MSFCPSQIDHPSSTPQALNIKAQGWSPQATYPGNTAILKGYPEGVTQNVADKLHRNSPSRFIEPFQGTGTNYLTVTQGSRSARQPWAMVCNAFSVVSSPLSVATLPKIVPRLAILIALSFGAASHLSAQVVTVESTDPDQEQPTTFKMKVSPAAEPKPALKHHFLVPPVDQIKGNAATLYYKAMSFESPDPFNDLNKFFHDDDKFAAAFDGPLERFPREEASRLVSWLNGSYSDWLVQAARCNSCDWEDEIRSKGVSTAIPQIQHARWYATALMLRARLQIVDRQYDEAIDTLAMAYALSCNLGHGTTLIHSLVGIAIQGITGNETRTFIAAEDSPNLYWALTDLAANPVDFRQALSYESRMWEFTIHELTELDRRIFTPDEALELAGRLSEISDSAAFWRISKKESHRLAGQLNFVATTFVLYPQAKAHLLEHGYAAAKIDAMPMVQTVLLCWWKQFEIVRDDAFKWILLPDSEVYQYLDRSDKVVKTAAYRKEGGVFTTLLPSVHAALHARIRSRRYTDMLRVVEALRMYAAAHGRWPEKLQDIKIVPVPLDPWTEKPFEYSLKDGVAILDMPAKPILAGGLRVNHRYELTLRKPKPQ